MAFGARQEDGKWRLCLRKGITIHGTDKISGTWEEFTFSSQAKAKACADELNEKFWPEFEKARKKDQWPTCGHEMVEVIRSHCKPKS